MSIGAIFDIAGSALSAQSIRLNTIASNIANAETVSSSVDQTYRARRPVFAAIHQQTLDDGLGGSFTRPFDNRNDAGVGVQVLGITESEAPLQRRYQPGNPNADEEGYVTYPNVNVVEEMADMISTSRTFQTNVQIMETATTMAQRIITLGQ